MNPTELRIFLSLLFASSYRLDREYRVRCRLSRADRRRFHDSRFQISIRRNIAGAAHPLSDAREAGERCAGQNDKCRSHHARDNRQRRAIYSPRICRRAVWKRSAARRDEIFHRVAGRDRPRQIEQAQRRHAREIPALRLSRHGGGGLPIA